MKKFIILFSYIIFVLLIPEVSSQTFFMVIGDWGRNGEYNQREVAEQMARWSEQNKAEFIISTGDNFYPKGVTSTSDTLWFTSYENVYTSAFLQIPWYVVAGNHDHHGNVWAQIDYSSISKRWKMPAKYYSFVKDIEGGTNALFVFLDTDPLIMYFKMSMSPDTQMVKEFTNQMKWLDSVLANTNTTWKFVTGHHPVYSGGSHGGELTLSLDFVPLFIKYNVNAYFCGHEHDMQHLSDGSVTQYFVSGAGSKTRDCTSTEYTVFQKGNTSGFLGVRLFPGKYECTFIDYLGNEIYKTEIKK